MWRWMFSSITIASSTTKPTEMVSAIKDRLSRLYPANHMSEQVPSSASGTVIDGMTVAQKLRKKTKITITTSAMVSRSVNCTSCTEARIVVVRSLRMPMWMAAGMVACRRGSSSLMRSTIWMTLAPGCLKTIRNTPRLPSAQAAPLTFSGPLTAWPMSRMRIGPPLRKATITSFQSPLAVSWSLA